MQLKQQKQTGTKWETSVVGEWREWAGDDVKSQARGSTALC